MLKSVEFPESIISIGNNAFKSCTSLELVSLPMSIQEFGTSIFADCNAIKEVNYLTETPIAADDKMFATAVYAQAILNLNADAYDMAKTISPWNKFTKVSRPEYLGIDEIDKCGDSNLSTEYFDLKGRKISTGQLTPGIYITRQGDKTAKTLIK